MKKLLATVVLVLGITGILSTLAPSASAQVACVKLHVRIGPTPQIDNQRICI